MDKEIMFGYLIVILAIVVALFAAFNYTYNSSYISGRASVIESCDSITAFYEGEKVYICQRVK